MTNKEPAGGWNHSHPLAVSASRILRATNSETMTAAIVALSLASAARGVSQSRGDWHAPSSQPVETASTQRLRADWIQSVLNARAPANDQPQTVLSTLTMSGVNLPHLPTLPVEGSPPIDGGEASSSNAPAASDGEPLLSGPEFAQLVEDGLNSDPSLTFSSFDDHKIVGNYAGPAIDQLLEHGNALASHVRERIALVRVSSDALNVNEESYQADLGILVYHVTLRLGGRAAVANSISHAGDTTSLADLALLILMNEFGNRRELFKTIYDQALEKATASVPTGTVEQLYHSASLS